MGLNTKREFQKQYKLWEERNEIRINEEANLREKFRLKLKEYNDRALQDFIDFFSSNEFEIKDIPLHVEASLDELKYHIKKGEPNTSKRYEFQLAEIDEKRREFIVVIQPKEDIYYPEFNSFRDDPTTLDRLKDDTKKIVDEILWLQNLIKEIDQGEFVYCYYSVENSKPDYSQMKKYDSFKNILSIIVED